MHMVIQCREYLRHTAAAKIAYKITHSRSIQVELGKVEVEENLVELSQENLVELDIKKTPRAKTDWRTTEHLVDITKKRAPGGVS